MIKFKHKLVGVALSAFFGGCAVNPYLLPSQDISDWKNPRAGAAQIGEACGVLYQANLRKNAVKNYVTILINNNSGDSIKTRPNEGKLVFDNGKERFPDVSAGELTLRDKEKMWLFLPFPEKTDFVDQTGISVELPLMSAKYPKGCQIKVHFAKDPALPVERSTITDLAENIFNVSIGSSLLKSGSQSEVSGNSLAIGFGYTAYFKNHGVFIGVNVEAGRDLKTTAAVPPAGAPSGKQLRMDSGMFIFGYSYRMPVASRWYANFDLGPGVCLIDYGTDLSTKNEYVVSHSFGIFQRAGIQYLAPRRVELQAGFALSLYNMYTPNASVGGVSYSGNSTGLMADFLFGF